jgi:hypothetical protein
MVKSEYCIHYSPKKNKFTFAILDGIIALYVCKEKNVYTFVNIVSISKTGFHNRR